MHPNTALYEQDFYTWTQTTAALLRAGKWLDIDAIRLAEEVESLGISQRHAIRSQLVRLLAHLLKYHYQPSQRSGSWEDTISDARVQIDLHIEDSPGLAAVPTAVFDRAYALARRQAGRETRLPLTTFPETCPWTLAEVRDDVVWPGTSPQP